MSRISNSSSGDTSIASKQDLEIVAKQLQRTPRGKVKVIKRCSRDLPMVILTYPVLSDGELFPTLFWLTCPHLAKEVSLLEAAGLIKQFEQLVSEENTWALELKRAHQKHQRLMFNLLVGNQNLPQKMPLLSREKPGVGGVRDFSRVKCLHAHYAHFLAGGNNPVGEVLDKTLSKKECKEECG